MQQTLTAEQQQALQLLQAMQPQAQSVPQPGAIAPTAPSAMQDLAGYDFGGLDTTPLHKRPAILAVGGVLGVLCLVGVGFMVGGKQKPVASQSESIAPVTPSLPIEAISIPNSSPSLSATPIPVVDPLSQGQAAVQFGNAKVNVPSDACLNLRDEPSAPPTDCLAPNTQLSVEYQSGEWANVVTQKGDRGWVYTKHLQFGGER